MKQLLLAYGCLVAFSIAHAASPVEERSIGSSQEPVRSNQPAPSYYPESAPLPAPQPIQADPTDTYGTLQMLQQEVMELRGLVEQLSYEVSQLKQRQIDDYLDLDRRISTSGSVGSTSPQADTLASQNLSQPGKSSSTPSHVISNTTSNNTSSVGGQSEVDNYSTAYNLLKDGQVDQAKEALQQHLQKFPQGQYAPNAYYWLGEIYLLENDLQKAAESFEIIVNQYPAHNKAADARFKLGKTYHLAGNSKARQVLEQAASGVGSSANLAKRYLEENF